MKKSKIVSLVLLTAACSASAQNPAVKDAPHVVSGSWDTVSTPKAYIRSDSTAPYARVPQHTHSGIPLYLVFRALTVFDPRYNSYRSEGYYSRGISHYANVGRNPVKTAITRGGFGGRTARAGS